MDSKILLNNKRWKRKKRWMRRIKVSNSWKRKRMIGKLEVKKMLMVLSSKRKISKESCSKTKMKCLMRSKLTQTRRMLIFTVSS